MAQLDHLAWAAKETVSDGEACSEEIKSEASYDYEVKSEASYDYEPEEINLVGPIGRKRSCEPFEDGGTYWRFELEERKALKSKIWKDCLR